MAEDDWLDHLRTLGDRQAFAALSQALASLFPSLPFPEPSQALSKEDRLDILIARETAHLGLWHPKDAIYLPTADRSAREVHRARNGSPVVGQIRRLEIAIDPSEIETVRDEIFADLAARYQRRHP